MSAMDFFGHQDAARRASGRLVWLFALAVLAIVGCIFAVVEALLLAADGRGPEPLAVFVAVAGVTGAIIGVAMLVKTSQLRSGGGAVARMLGGTEVPLSPSDPQEQVLRNVVEEMAIAAGVPVPEIYVLEQESGINAFAAGWSPADAAIAVTRGCLQQLDRDELQGVIAHEFSHVCHGDMRLNIRLIGVLFGIVCITTIGRIVLRAAPRSGRSDKKGGAAAILLFGLALVVIGGLGVFFARLIQAAVSRQREFLADASAVQYTRNPHGIGMALAKIGGLGGRLESAHAEEASHLLFADGVKRFLGGAFATHPPLETRIARVLPGFVAQRQRGASLTAAVAATPVPPGAAGLAGTAAPAGPTPPPRPRGRDLVASVGDVQELNLRAAKALLASLPLDLAAMTHEPQRARALVAALLLDRDPARREAQFAMLTAEGADLVHDTRLAFQAVARLDRSVRLPLVELALPALRSFPADGRARMRQQLRALALADGNLSVFEWALLRTVERHVRDDATPPPRPGRPEALAEHGDAAAVVLTVLARIGARGDDGLAAAAFARGVTALGSGQELAMLPAAASGSQALEAAVDRLGRVSPLGKRNLLQACAEAATADGTIDADETDLLRALALLWDCPMPLPAASGIR